MTIINMPMDYTAAEHIDLSKEEGVFWKQIIPLNKTIVYNGQKITFDKTMLSEAKTAFENKVLDQTAFQLANDNNQHDTAEDIAAGRNMDPQRFRGEIDKLALNNRGLFARFKLTKDGVELIKQNPKLGVSASLKPNYVDSDGKSHPIVLRHVLGTLDPKIKGMSPWTKEEIELSVSDDVNEEVIDLAAADTDTPPTPNNEGAEKVEVDKTEFEGMKAQLAELADGDKLLQQILDETEEDDKVSLSNEEPPENPEITKLKSKVAASEWKAERAEFTTKGVPASLLNLAEEALAQPEGSVINLSTGDEINEREIIRKMLHEAEGFVDLSAESGHGMNADETSAADGFVKAFEEDTF